MAKRLKIFFDGGYRPGPMGMETAVVIGGQAHVRRDLGPGTSMAAEWLALIEAVRIGLATGVRDIVILGDAAAVVAQANGRAKCPAAHVPHLAALRELTAATGMPTIRYIKRTQNFAGITLARLHGSR